MYLQGLTIHSSAVGLAHYPAAVNYFAFLLTVLFFHNTQRGVEINNVEIQPEIIPVAIGIPKLRRVERPKISETPTIITTATKVARAVTIVLAITELTLMFTSSAFAILG